MKAHQTSATSRPHLLQNRLPFGKLLSANFPLLLALLLPNCSSPAADASLTVASGPFEPTMDSLKQYHAPDWFRDAKFGMWAHWGPQAVPMDGDWYARGLYEPGNHHYQ